MGGRPIAHQVEGVLLANPGRTVAATTIQEATGLLLDQIQSVMNRKVKEEGSPYRVEVRGHAWSYNPPQIKTERASRPRPQATHSTVAEVDTNTADLPASQTFVWVGWSRVAGEDGLRPIVRDGNGQIYRCTPV